MFLGSSSGTGLSGRCRFGIKSLEAPPGNRLMLGHFMMHGPIGTGVTGVSYQSADYT